MTLSTPELQDFVLSDDDWAAVQEMRDWLKVIIVAFVFEDICMKSIIDNLLFLCSRHTSEP